jgi:hypothetical protein
MRWSTFLAMIALTLTVLAPSTASAGPITYTIDDYSALGIQDNNVGQPVLMSGTITTNGTIGSGITAANVILNWSITFTQGGTTTTNNKGINSKIFILGAGLDITDTSIRLHNGAGAMLQLLDPTASTAKTVWGADIYNNDPLSGSPGSTNWHENTPNFGSPNFSPIAELQSVPEPATLTLLGIGIVGMAGYAWRRKKRT